MSRMRLSSIQSSAIRKLHDEKEHTLVKIQDSTKRETPIAAIDLKDLNDLGALCDGHLEREFADRDVNATMETMVPEPYVYCVPSMIGGFGGQGVRRFYSGHLVNQTPKDAKVTPISRT